MRYRYADIGVGFPFHAALTTILIVFITCFLGSDIVFIISMLSHCAMCPRPTVFSLNSCCTPCRYRSKLFESGIAFN